MTKRSVKERYLNEMKRYFAGRRNRLKPPFRCPKCFRENAIHVEKEKIEKVVERDDNKKFIREFNYRVYCQHGCFDMTFTYTSPVKTELDAYCECCDEIRRR